MARVYEITYRAGDKTIRRTHASFVDALLEARRNAKHGWVVKAGPEPVTTKEQA